MQANWAAVGITVNIEQLEYATMLSHYVDGTFQLGPAGGRPTTPSCTTSCSR